MSLFVVSYTVAPLFAFDALVQMILIIARRERGRDELGCCVSLNYSD